MGVELSRSSSGSLAKFAAIWRAVLRESIANASVDLIYLDPPFNSNGSYNVFFKAPWLTFELKKIFFFLI